MVRTPACTYVRMHVFNIKYLHVSTSAKGIKNSSRFHIRRDITGIGAFLNGKYLVDMGKGPVWRPEQRERNRDGPSILDFLIGKGEKKKEKKNGK